MIEPAKGKARWNIERESPEEMDRPPTLSLAHVDAEQAGEKLLESKVGLGGHFPEHGVIHTSTQRME